MSAITFSSMLIPVIRARRASSRAEVSAQEQESEGEGEPLMYDDPPPVYVADGPLSPPTSPAPTSKQLLTLSATLRKRFASSTPHPFDGIFMLRQLNMITQTPHLTLPSPLPANAQALELLPEKWIWRLPATTAINSILRILHDPACEDRTRDALLPLAVALANHAHHWDSLIWTAVLFSRGHSHSLPWERVLARVRGQTGGQGLQEEVAVMTRLDERERMQGKKQHLEGWEKGIEEKQRQRWSSEPTKRQSKQDETDVRAGGRRAEARVAQAKEPLSDRLLRIRVAADQAALKSLKASTLPSPLPPTLHPLSSLPQQTLDILFLFLAQHPDRSDALTSAALGLALGRSELSLPSSRRTLVHAINMGLEHGRPDLASRLWLDMLRAAQRDGTGTNQLTRLFDKIKHKLRDGNKRYRSAMGRATFASVATMARGLDCEWVRLRREEELVAAQGGVRAHSTLNEMIDLLATFPFAPFARDFEPNTERRRVAHIHHKVDKMTRKVFRGIIEEVIDLPIYLGPLKVVVGKSTLEKDNDTPRPRLPLNAHGYNSLITYSLRQFHSSEIALRLVQTMRQQGVDPNPATHNILLDILAQSSEDALALVGSTPTNEHTLPTLVKYLSKAQDTQQIERIVFFLLPELDISTPAPSESESPTPASDSPFDPLPATTPNGTIPTSSAPPPGRSKWLYMALLAALVSAGRTGLAERVFRSARWAAELSRQRLAPPSSDVDVPPLPSPKGAPAPAWSLPPEAFLLMLKLYAGEVQRGDALASQDPSRPSAYVRGWGRHALRVFILSERRAELLSRLGEEGDVKRRVRGTAVDVVGAVVPFLRSEAAPIVATWELEGGSRGPELESLRRALKSWEGRRALGRLFPEKSMTGEEREREERRWDAGSRGGRDAWRERCRVKSLARRDRNRRMRRRSGEEGQ